MILVELQIISYEEDFNVKTNPISSFKKLFSQIVRDANPGISPSENQIKFLSINTECDCRTPNSFSTKADVNDIYGTGSTDNIKILISALNLIILAKKGDPPSIPVTKSVRAILDELENKYEQYIDAEASSIDVYNNTISGLIYLFDQYAGNGTAFSILNCRFIGKNIKILLKYLDKSLAKSFYTIGICLDVAGFTMLFSISFTILLHIILQIRENVSLNLANAQNQVYLYRN